MAIGYEQVRSIVAALVGDMKSKRKVELELPETGVFENLAGLNVHDESEATLKASSKKTYFVGIPWQTSFTSPMIRDSGMMQKELFESSRKTEIFAPNS